MQIALMKINSHIQIAPEISCSMNWPASDKKSGQQYRFVLPEAPLSEAEWTRCLGALESFVQHARFVIANGSLPPNVPNDFTRELPGLRSNQDAKWRSILLEHPLQQP
jgi:fructose-1-phosphate kinase PfkB-like protein